jgi:hypothetical protein
MFVTAVGSFRSVRSHLENAAIPMLCKAEACPYAEVCPLMDAGMAPEGERCPIEIAMILRRYEEYTKEFGIDESNVVDSYRMDNFVLAW